MDSFTPLSTNDIALLNWLNSIPIDPSQVDVKIEGLHVKINCRNDFLGLKLWSHRQAVQSIGFSLEVSSNGELIDSTRRMKKNASRWAARYPLHLIDLSNLCSVSIHSEGEGYPFLAVQPYLGNEAALNKPVDELLGQPLVTVASEIAEAKEHCIRRAIANGDIAHESYEMYWQGNLWKKQITAIYLPGSGEVMTKTSHAKGEEWQIGYWRNHFKTLNQE